MPISARKKASLLSQVKLLWQINDVSRRVKVPISGRPDDALVTMTRKRQSHGGAWGRWTHVHMWSQSLCPGYKWPAPSGAATLSIQAFLKSIKFKLFFVTPTHDTGCPRFGLIPLPMVGSFLFCNPHGTCHTLGYNLFPEWLIQTSSQRYIPDRRSMPSTGLMHRDSVIGLKPHALNTAVGDSRTLLRTTSQPPDLRILRPGAAKITPPLQDLFHPECEDLHGYCR